MVTKGNTVLFAQNLINLITNIVAYGLVLRYRHGSTDPFRSSQS